MTLPAIRAVGVSKKYALGGRVPYLTLRETIMAAARFKRRARPDGSQEHWALKDVNFEVQRGEVVGIIGRNGAGKSTLLKVLSRITDPTTGRVEIRGRVASLLEVGTGFHPELTGRENVSLNGAILGMRRAEITRKFDEIVAFAEVEKFIDTPVKYYSSGMYLRLAFAVAAHFESEILIVDEVLAVGDQAFQQRCLGKMGDAANSGRTVLLVSHNMAAVESLCERAMLLSGGAIVAEGRVDEVVRRYATLGTSVLDESLADRTDRRGTGTLRFESLRLYVEGGDQHGLYSGCEAVVRLGYRANVEASQLHVAISVLDQYDRMLFACDSTHAGGALSVGDSGIIECVIPDLPLSPGSYRMTLWASVAGAVADHVTHAAEFSVSPADYFGTGKLPDHPKFGPLLVRHRWTNG
jgi:lipopolysaccharide transport system ATP-binding protein